MKNNKKEWIILFTIIAILINLLGRNLASELHLPIWCDSIGTLFMAYVAGPVCGGIVGCVSNIIYGIYVDQQTIYCIVGAFLGVMVGFLARKKMLESRFYVMTLGMVLAVFSTLLSFIINLVFYGGEIGNVWGDQMMLMCNDVGIPRIISCFIGQFYVEFLDKLISVEIIYLLLRCFRGLRKKQVSSCLMIFFILTLAGGLLGTGNSSSAKELSENDYNTYMQSTYGNQEGLLAGEANDITQTKDGRLWIGTYAGLYKYDGVKFKLFQDIESVKNVNTLFADEEGRLWVGTNDSGVSILINEHVMNVIDDTNGLPSSVVKCITCDSNGNYYIGTTDGIAVISLSGGVKVVKQLKQIKNAITLVADKKGNVVAITDDGSIFWIQEGEVVSSPIDSMPEHFYTAAYFASDGRLFFGTATSQMLIYNMDSETPVLEHKYECKGIKYINTFYETERGELFICSDTGVALICKNGRYEKINTNHFTSSIDDMVVDYQGNLWFTSSRLGLLKLTKSSFINIFSELGIEESVTNTTEHYDGHLMCGTDNGLVVIDEKEQKECRNNPLSKLLKNVRVRCLKVDSSNDLWIATTDKGVYQVHKKADHEYDITNYSEKEGMPGNRFRNIIETQDGAIVTAGDLGVAYIRHGKVEDVLTEGDGLVNVKSLCLLEHNGTVYVGSDGGGISEIVNGRVVSRLGKEDGLSSDVILRMVYDEVTKGIFIVTSNSLCYMSMDGKIKTLKHFPYSNNFDIIMGDNGSCWILSSAGIYVADVKSLVEDKTEDYFLLNTRRGLRESITANAWSCYDGGILHLCCDSGAVKVNMDEYEETSKSYRMIVDHATVDGNKCAINRIDPLHISSKSNCIDFEPEILNYSMDDPYVSYYMEGYDAEPKIVRLSELEPISYSNLRPGAYVFTVSVLDHIGGNVVETGSYHIVKEKEMYQNWWFKLYMVVVAALVIIWITWFITRTQTQKTVIQQRLELEYAKKQLQMGNEMIISIARTVDAKDSNTSEHSYRVSQYSVAIAKRCGYTREQCENLRQMALLHDIGKIGIPDAILNKPDKLTDEEYEIMKTHVLRGGEILKDFTMIENVNVGALYHHERYDGKGYCHGLKGEEIPLDARIIGIADAFDAMTANRVYRKQLNLDFVLAELKRCSGTQFDPDLVEIMLTLIEEGEIDVERLYAESKKEK